MNQLAELEERINGLLKESKDPNFTIYLRQLLVRVLSQKRQADALAEELDRNEQIYYNNLQLLSKSTMSVGQGSMSQGHAPVKQTARWGDNTEFAIGATLLSIIGSVFILAAFVMLGKYFMTGFLKGMLMYAGSLLVMLLAEFLVYRKFPRLGTALSAVGMGGLYVATVLNYLILENFAHWTAVAVTLVITLSVIFISRKRDAVFYRIMGMAAMYLCVFMIMNGNEVGQAAFLTVSVIVFLVNVMCLCMPVKRFYSAINIVQMLMNTFFALTVFGMWTEKDLAFASVGEVWYYPVGLLLFVVTMQLIFAVEVQWKAKQNPSANKANRGIGTAYGVSALIFLFLTARVTDFVRLAAVQEDAGWSFSVSGLLCTVTVILVCAVFMLVLKEKREKWVIWYFLNSMILAIHSGSESDLERFLCLFVLLMIAKAFSFGKEKMLYISDAVLTAFCSVCILLNHKNPYAIILFAGILVSVPCIRYWKTYQEMLLTFTIAFYAAGHMISLLKLPVFVGTLFVGMFLYNSVERWRGKGILVYNILCLWGQVVCYLLLAHPKYQNAYLTYLCMFVFGVTTIVVCIQRKCGLDFPGKAVLPAVFCSYMAIILRTGYPVVNSILLMIIALGCVGVGFYIEEKSVRMYGLALSLIVCLKMVLYDFRGINVLQKTILFFAAGVVAFLIASIYMILEHNWEKQRNWENGEKKE